MTNKEIKNIIGYWLGNRKNTMDFSLLEEAIQNLLNKQRESHQKEIIALNKMLNQDCLNQLDKQREDIKKVIDKKLKEGDTYDRLVLGKHIALKEIKEEIDKLNK